MLYLKQMVFFQIQIKDTKTIIIGLPFGYFYSFYPLKVMCEFMDEGTEYGIMVFGLIVFIHPISRNSGRDADIGRAVIIKPTKATIGITAIRQADLFAILDVNICVYGEGVFLA